MNKWVLTVPMLFALGACATVPAPLTQGVFARMTPLEGRGPDAVGQTVRWGGEIVTTLPGKDETCFEVVSRPLDSEARPKQTDRSEGRFIACAMGFYDPAVYAAGREMTVVGTVQPSVVRNIGEYPYRFPRVKASQVYLWPKREPERWAPGYDPFWGYPWGPWPYRPWYPY